MVFRSFFKISCHSSLSTRLTASNLQVDIEDSLLNLSVFGFQIPQVIFAPTSVIARLCLASGYLPPNPFADVYPVSDVIV